MFFSSSMRATAILATALTLAACGSDKAAGPTTANNEQIISEMSATLADTASFDPDTDYYRLITLQLAIAGLSSGAPVNPGNVTIDGRQYRFNTTSIVAEERDSVSGDVLYRMGIVVGWRHTSGDSVFIAAYTTPEAVATDRRTSLSLMQQSVASKSKLADIAAMIRSGSYSVSKSVSAGGPDQPMLLAVYLGGSFYGAVPEQGVVSGSISYSAASGDCDVTGANNGGAVDISADSCEPVSSNAAMQANTFDPMSETDPPAAGPVITIPAQTVVGVRFISRTGTTPM